MRLTSHKRGKPAPSGRPSLAGNAVSQPQRLVLELLLQEAVPDKLDTTNHERLVKRLVDKGQCTGRPSPGGRCTGRTAVDRFC